MVSSTASTPATPYEKNWWRQTFRQCFAEFLGDFMFIFVGSLSAASGNIVAISFAHGLTIFILVTSFGHVSGGHFNPAVTLGIATARLIHPIKALFYIISQLLGGFVGALFVRVVQTYDVYSKIHGITTIDDNFPVGRAIICEAVLTFFLVQTVLNAAVDSDGANMLAPLAIGLTVGVDIYAGGGLSGASMNPARSLGPSIAASIFNIEKPDPWKYQYVYWAGPAIGAIVAAIFYRIALARNSRRLLF